MGIEIHLGRCYLLYHALCHILTEFGWCSSSHIVFVCQLSALTLLCCALPNVVGFVACPLLFMDGPIGVGNMHATALFCQARAARKLERAKIRASRKKQSLQSVVDESERPLIDGYSLRHEPRIAHVVCVSCAHMWMGWCSCESLASGGLHYCVLFGLVPHNTPHVTHSNVMG